MSFETNYLFAFSWSDNIFVTSFSGIFYSSNSETLLASSKNKLFNSLLSFGLLFGKQDWVKTRILDLGYILIESLFWAF